MEKYRLTREGKVSPEERWKIIVSRQREKYRLTREGKVSSDERRQGRRYSADQRNGPADSISKGIRMELEISGIVMKRILWRARQRRRPWDPRNGRADSFSKGMAMKLEIRGIVMSGILWQAL